MRPVVLAGGPINRACPPGFEEHLSDDGIECKLGYEGVAAATGFLITGIVLVVIWLVHRARKRDPNAPTEF